jgi:hypothetical protein
MKYLNSSLIFQYFSDLKIGKITSSFVFLFFVIFIIIGGFLAISIQFLLFGSDFNMFSLAVNINSYIITFSISLIAESLLSEMDNPNKLIIKILRKFLFTFVICLLSTIVIKIFPSVPLYSLLLNFSLTILLWKDWWKEALNDSRITSYDQI